MKITKVICANHSISEFIEMVFTKEGNRCPVCHDLRRIRIKCSKCEFEGVEHGVKIHYTIMHTRDN